MRPLVRIPSENPPGDTTRIATSPSRHLRGHGIRPALHEPRRGTPNVVATLGRGAPNLVLSGHLDEFPAGEGWSFPPFSGRIRAGRIWGRGAGDMRAGLAVALFVMGLVRESGLTPRGTLTLAFASDEETGGTWGTQWLLQHVRTVRGDACLIGESSGTWSAGIGEKGVLWARVCGDGVSGHAAYALGESAVARVLAVLRAAEKLGGARGRPPAEVATVMRRQRAAAERHWGPGTGRIAERVTVNVGTIRGGGQVNLIPARCEADVDFRLPPGLPTTAVLENLRRWTQSVPGTAFAVLNQCESYVTAPGERLVRLVLDNARSLRGLEAVPVVRPGYTDGRFFRRAGIPTVVYGPRVRAMGGPDESIDARELVDVAMVHLGVALDYLGPPRLMAEPLVIAGVAVPPGAPCAMPAPHRDGRWPRGQAPPAPVNGARPGPSLYLGAAIHGDEVNGVAMPRACSQRRPGSTRRVSPLRPGPESARLPRRPSPPGRPLPEVAARPDAHRPVDGFPGDPAGQHDRAARPHALRAHPRVRAAIDVHTPTRGGRYVPISILPIPRCPPFRRADALARAFGSGYIMATASGMYVRDGILCVEATRAGVPCFTFEIGEGGPWSRGDGDGRPLRAERHAPPRACSPAIPSRRRRACACAPSSACADARTGSLTRTRSSARRGGGRRLARIQTSMATWWRRSWRPRRPFVRTTTFSAVAAGERVATLGLE